MSQQRHIISRTVLELNTGRMADVWSLQEEASQAFYQRLVPELERLFERLVEPDEVVRLDQVVVNVGPISPQALPDELPHQVVAELDRILSDRLSLLRLQKQLVGTSSTSDDAEISLHDRITADGEVLLYFLRYGRLPWWCPTEDWQVWVPRWEAALQQQTNWRQPLQTLLATNPTAQQRFVVQLPAGFRQQCLLQLQPAWTGWPGLLAQARRLMQALSLSHQGVKSLETQAWLLLLAEIRPDSPITRPLPAVTWVGHWLTVMLQTGLSEGAIAPETTALPEELDSQILGQPGQEYSDDRQIRFYQQIEQRLRSALETLSAADRALWLEAMHGVIAKFTQTERPREPSTLPAPRSDSASPQNSEVPSESGKLSPDQTAQPAEQSSPENSQIAESSDISPRSDTQTERVGAPSTMPAPRSDSASPQNSEVLSESEAPSPDQTAQPAEQSSLEGSQISESSDISPRSDTQTERVGAPSTMPAPRSDSASPQSSEVLSESEAPSPDQTAQPAERLPEESSQVPERVNDFPESDDISDPDWMEAFRRNGMILPPSQWSGRSPLSTEEETNGLHIRQAGLVLLHPFLQIYLGDVGLLAGEAFRDEAAQQRAIYLLHYLASGQTTAPEPELVLSKLLCGWPLNDPVEADLELPEAALAEGEHLLETVIGYWEALKNTSPDGLREGFLQREGKLTRTENGWKLQVERQSIDILLGQLPWGVSMVKLPWMSNLLVVEWT
jgi:hypothetical protein